MAPIPDAVWARVREPLAFLLKGLSSQQSPEELQNVRQAIVHALLSGQEAAAIDPLTLIAEGPNDSSDQRALRQQGISLDAPDFGLVDSLRPSDASLVVAQQVVLRPFGIHESSQLFVRDGNGVKLVPVSTFGPLVDLQGRRMELVVFKLTPFTAVRDGPFINTNLVPTPNIQFRFTFGPCTMWVPAAGFVSSAPGNGYFGLRLRGGTSISPPAPGSQVQLQLEPQTPWPAPLGSRFSRILPDSLSIGYSGLPNPGRPNLSSFSASCVLFGNTLNFHYQLSNGSAEYDTVNGRILFPLVPGTTAITISETDADLVHFSGTAQITRAYWALPVVPFTNQPQFAPVSTNGSLLVRVSPGLRSRFANDKDIWTYGEVEVAIDETAAIISGQTAWTSATRNLNMWLHGNPAAQGRSANIKRSTVTLKSKSISANVLKRGFPFKYLIQSNSQESWTYSAGISGSFSSPVSIDGARMPFSGVAAVFFTRPRPGLLPRVSIESRDPHRELGAQRTSYLTENMLIVVDQPTYLFAYGEYSPDDRAIVTGSLNLPATLLEATPVLADPYVSNIVQAPFEFFLDMRFQLVFDGTSNLIANIQLSKFPLDRIRALDRSPFNPSTDQFKLPATDLSEKIQNKRIENWDKYTSLQPFLANDPTLLDISSNSSQLGITFPTGGSSSMPVTVNNTTFSAPANNLKLFCLPAVQWEAVYIEDATAPGTGRDIQYPSASGFPTKISTASASLVPLTPTSLAQRAVSAYNLSLSPIIRSSPVTASFQLPFGMLAKAGATNPTRKSLRLVQPSFNKEVPPAFQPSPPTQASPSSKVTLTSAPNLSFNSRTEAELHAGFPGLALLPSQALSPYPDVITHQFNTDFLNRAPLTQFSLSGYGASIFSNWSPLPIPTTGIAKVEMDVLLGRANRQVVQMISLLYPFGVRVIRTVTILRGNNGVVRGVDSGWVACSDGRYDFGEAAAPGSEVKVHFGLVRGVKDVRNIRLLEGSENLVSYDCLMEIEGVDGNDDGAETGWVSVQGQIGYIITRSAATNAPPTPLTPSEYLGVMNKISQENGGKQLGGPVDVVVKLRNSEQKVRVSRVLAGTCTNTAAATATANALEFPMELWGTPIVPESGGQWVFTTSVRKELGKSVQEAVDSWGVPLVRQGLDKASSVASAIKIAGSGDLFKTAWDESTAYNLIHAGDSYRVMFPSPELIPGANPGDLVKGLTSQVPILADGFALAASTTGSIFPELEKRITLKDASQVLDVLAGGHYEYKAVLEEGKKLALEEAKRFLRQDGNFASVVTTAGNLLPDGTNNAYLDLAISTLKNTKDLSLTNLSMITQGESGKELNRVVGSVLSSAQNLPIFKDAEHIFGELLGQVQKVVNFLNKLKVLPPLKVSITNEWAMEVSTSMGLDDFLKKLGPGAEAIKEIVQVLNFALKARTTPTSANFTLSVDVTIKIPTGFGPTVLGVGGFLVRAGTDGNVVQMTLGAGIGVSFQVGPFGASAYYTQSQSIIISKDLYGVAATCVLKVHVSLVVATADLMLEARLGLIGGPCHKAIHDQHPKKEDTIFVYAQVRIALHVSIFLVINVTVDETAEWENNMNSGPCLLKDMEPMPEG